MPERVLMSETRVCELLARIAYPDATPEQLALLTQAVAAATPAEMMRLYEAYLFASYVAGRIRSLASVQAAAASMKLPIWSANPAFPFKTKES
jgi:hypothetical protein